MQHMKYHIIIKYTIFIVKLYITSLKCWLLNVLYVQDSLNKQSKIREYTKRPIQVLTINKYLKTMFYLQLSIGMLKQQNLVTN